MRCEERRSFGFKQFRYGNCFSYLVFDPASRQAMFIDARADQIDHYRSVILETGLKPVMSLDTHLHSDHFSATHLLKREFGLQVLMAANTLSERPDRRLYDGEKVRLGQLEWVIKATPGHTADSIVVFGDGHVFTGDTLLISSSGLIEEDLSSDVLASSLRLILDHLADGDIIFTGHDFNGLLFSTAKVEKNKNPHYLISDVFEFSHLKKRESLDCGVVFKDQDQKKIIEFNLTSFPNEDGFFFGGSSHSTRRDERSHVTSMSVEKYSAKLANPSGDCAYIDVREPQEFEVSHIPGTRNLPVSEIPFVLEELSQYRKIYVSCLSGCRSLSVANTLNYLGFSEVVNVLGGIRSWTQRGLPLNRFPGSGAY